MRLTLLIICILLAGCSTTSKLAWGTLYMVDSKEIESIRGTIVRENFLLAKDMSFANSGIVTIEKLSRNGESDYYITVRYQGPSWRFMEDIDLKIDGDIITLTDESPYRHVNSGGGVEETVRCYLSEAAIHKLINCGSMDIQYFSRPISIPFEGLMAMKGFLIQ